MKAKAKIVTKLRQVSTTRSSTTRLKIIIGHGVVDAEVVEILPDPRHGVFVAYRPRDGGEVEKVSPWAALGDEVLRVEPRPSENCGRRPWWKGGGAGAADGGAAGDSAVTGV